MCRSKYLDSDWCFYLSSWCFNYFRSRLWTTWMVSETSIGFIQSNMVRTCTNENNNNNNHDDNNDYLSITFYQMGLYMVFSSTFANQSVDHTTSFDHYRYPYYNDHGYDHYYYLYYYNDKHHRFDSSLISV